VLQSSAAPVNAILRFAAVQWLARVFRFRIPNLEPLDLLAFGAIEELMHTSVTRLILLSLALVAPVIAQTPPHAAPLRVVIIGLVHGHVEGFFQYSLHRPDIQLVGIAESNQQLAADYAKKYSLDPKLLFTSADEMLSQTHPQAALVYSNTRDHRQAVEICARHGVPVMMEKPLAVSVEDAHAIQTATQQGHIQVVVNYETTWYSSNRAAYDLVHQNALGDVRKIVIHDGHNGPKEIGVGPEFLSWLTDPKLNGGGALFDFGCYGADLATWLMDGQRPLTVTAVTQHIKPEIYPNVDDEATIVLTYPKAQAILQASWNWPFGRKDMEVYGQSGYVITVGRDAVRIRRPHEDKEEAQVTAPQLVAPHDDSLTYLRAVVLDGLKPEGLSSLETNIIVVEILDAARRSAADGKTVRIAQ
jgi:predicted dehydrogenase